MTELVQETDRKNLVEMIQRLDYLKHTRFHATLLCHADQSLDWRWNQRPLDDYYLYSFLEPQGHVQHYFSGAVISFTHGNVNVATQKPEEVATLIYLYEVQPARVLFTDLLNAVDQRLQEQVKNTLFPKAFEPECYYASLSLFLYRLFARGCIDFYTQPGRYATQVSDYPKATRLARMQARQHDVVTTQIHRSYKLNSVEKILLPLLDGKQGKQALVKALQKAITTGKLPLDQADMEVAPEVLAEDFVALALRSLCQAALLIQTDKVT